MKKLILLVALMLSACIPTAPSLSQPPVAIAAPPTATAYIDPSYPTSAATSASPNQVAGGIDVRVDRAWRDGKAVNANVCFSLPDASDWSIWKASLIYGTTTLEEYGTTLVSMVPPANGQPGQRCDTLTFIVAPDADLSNTTILIDSFAAPPTPDEYCSVYMPKIQRALAERNIAITLGCTASNGAMTMQITGKPADMTQQQAEQIVFSDEFYTVKGPWTFAFNLGQ